MSRLAPIIVAIGMGWIGSSVQSKAQTCTPWIRLSPMFSPEIGLGGGAFDSHRNVTVLYTMDLTAMAATWEWNGNTWLFRAAGGPTPRYEHGLAFDELRGVTVLFGGTIPSQGNSASDETWEWNGTVWTQRFPTHVPPTSTAVAMCYDSDRGRIVMFAFSSIHMGGGGGTWEWDGIDWTEISTANVPYRRSGPALAYDPHRQRCVMFGGSISPGPLAGSSETWEYDGQNWSQQFPSVAPPPRVGATASYDPNLGEVLIFGGVDASGGTPIHHGDVWSWNGTRWCRRSSTGPAPRFLHMFTFDAARNEHVLFGGVDFNEAYADTWRLQLSTWNGGSGDGNLDGRLDGRDLQALVDSLLIPAAPNETSCAYDMNGDSVVDEADVSLFVSLLLGQ